MSLRRILFVCTLLLFSAQSIAQRPEVDAAKARPVKRRAFKKKANPKKITGERPTTIEYGSAGWNRSATKVDSAFLFIRDKESGKLAKVVLDETAPDSSTFKGNFSLGWASEAKTEPEVYIPPQNLVGEKGMEKFKSMLRAGKLKRKPVVYHTDQDGRQMVDVYDTKEQAVQAYKAFKQETELAKRKEQADDLLVNANTDEATMEVAAQAEQQKLLKQLESEAAKREAERIRLEQLELQKAEERRKAAAALAEAEKKRRQNEAVRLGEQGMQKFLANDFAGAAELFKQAVEMDPLNTNYNLNYGIALYRQEKYNEALVILHTTPENEGRKTEKFYYEGLSYYNLKEINPAKLKFEFVKQQTDPNLSPSAAFYLGLLHMAEERYDKAEENFQFVLDNSNSPELDNQAEAYIESLASLKAFAKKRQKPFTAAITLGAMYDSNVLLTPSGQAAQDATGSEEADIRAIASGTLAYRAIYNKKHEWTPKYFNYLIYSSKEEASPADPFVNNVSLPYSYKGTAFNKGYKLTINPQYETINMDINEDGAQELIYNSTVLNIDNTFVMSGMWIASYIAEIRLDESSIASATGDNDLDSTKYTLRTNHINFLDNKRKKLLSSYASLIQNDAKGKNRTYTRIDLSSTYIKPLNWWKSTWTFGLTVYRQEFTQDDDGRTDMNTTVATGISRPVNEWLTWSLNMDYSTNNSTVDDFTYQRYSATSTFTATTDF